MTKKNPEITVLTDRQKLKGWEVVRWHLLPGAVSVTAYLILAFIFSRAGLPQILALMLAVPFAEAPFTWWLMKRRLRQEGIERFSFGAAFPWWRKVPVWLYGLAVPLVLLNVGLMMFGLTRLDPFLISKLFSWVPDWMVMGGFSPDHFQNVSRDILLLMWGLSLIGMTIIGGFTQEIYFRGFLLPRMAHTGAKAVVINAALFAMMHFVAPWGWPIFFINALIWALLVYWRRSAKIGIFMHMGMLFVQWLGMTMVVFGLAPSPGMG